MKKIISIYGRFLLDALVIVILLFLVFTQIQDNNGNKGALHIIGARLVANVQNTDYYNYTDFDKMLADSTKPNPAISYVGSNSIQMGHVVLSDYINAMDYSGAALPIKVLKVVDPTGVEIASNQNTEIECTLSGIYTVTVSAVDNICKKTVCTIQIPINR